MVYQGITLVGDHRDGGLISYYSELVFAKEQGDWSDLELIIMLRFGDCRAL